MTNTDTKPAPSVEDAAKRAEDARRHFHTLTKQLTGGDTDVTAENLEAARARAEHAELALKGAQARARREAEERLKADVEAFRKSYPRKLDKRFKKVVAARAKASEALGELLDAASAHKQTRDAVQAEWEALRPDDIPLDFDNELPAHYKAANPRDDYRIPHVDWFKTALAAALDAIKSRHRGVYKAGEAEIVRTLTSFTNAHETSYKHAVTKEK